MVSTVRLLGDQVKESLKPPYQIAAQNSWARGVGAYTGEIAPELLVDLGIGWVILGHSERRSIIGESSELVSACDHLFAASLWTHHMDSHLAPQEVHPWHTVPSLPQRCCRSAGEHEASQILSSFVHLQVADKTEYALHHGLKAIVCIGETLDQRESGELWNVLDSQLKVLVQ